MKILFLVPDGVGIRNYLYSDILKELKTRGDDVTIWHILSSGALKEVEDLHNLSLRSESLPPYKESFIEKFFRESSRYARLLHNARIRENPTLIMNWMPKKKSILHKIFYFFVEIYGKFTSNKYKRIVNLDNKHYEIMGTKLQPYIEFLKSEKPDMLFCTNQRALNAAPAVLAAQSLNIQTIGAIYSWDNLPKADLKVRTDKYIVWSKYMQKEIDLYYPELKGSSVVTGTPQFDFYKDETLLIDRKVFCDLYKLDENACIICFSGDDDLTSPHDPLYLEDLAEVIQNGTFEKKIQILFRRSPVDLSGRYKKVIHKYSDIIRVVEPLWNFDNATDSWMLIYARFDDVKLLVNIAQHCESVINIGSTMALDFSLFNKPGMYLNYDHFKDEKWSVKTTYAFEHFKSMQGLEGVVWLESKEDIFGKISKLLKNPKQMAIDKKDWFEIINEMNESPTLNIMKLMYSKGKIDD